jgi:hypothetical protein
MNRVKCVNAAVARETESDFWPRFPPALPRHGSYI